MACFSERHILVLGMPLLIEIVILFDLLIVVACFGVLVQYLLSHVGTRAPCSSSGWWGDDADDRPVDVAH